MDAQGRANHIEDFLVTYKEGQWFGWSDSKNKTYENLITHDGTDKPSEEVVNSGLKAMQDNFDSYNYKTLRERLYPSWGEQLDYIYHHGIDKWKTDIVDKVKNKIPKPS
tara:strand:- start:335 stop:661 length:327 start_codon:yes stop_codon:yes gene_type:complete